MRPTLITHAWAVLRHVKAGEYALMTSGNKSSPRWSYKVFQTRAAAENMMDSEGESVRRVAIVDVHGPSAEPLVDVIPLTTISDITDLLTELRRDGIEERKVTRLLDELRGSQ